MSGITIEVDKTWIKAEATVEESDWLLLCIEWGFEDPTKVSVNDKFLLMENRSSRFVWGHIQLRHGRSDKTTDALNKCAALEAKILEKYV